MMYMVETRRGFLAIANDRSELNAWSGRTCRDWLMTNDPNGAWTDEESSKYDTTEDEYRDAVWEQMNDD